MRKYYIPVYYSDFPAAGNPLTNENYPEATLRFENSANKTDEGELVNILEDANIWIHDYDSNGRSLFSQTTWHELTRRKTRLRSLGSTFITSDNDRTAIEWLDEVDDLIKILRGSEHDSYDRLKIAVIDSGIHDSQKLQYQAEYRDFTNHAFNDSWHGTSCASIIREMYAETKFYIARIFKNDHADEDEGPLLMAKAILWAIEPPRSVDIVSISAGFPNYSKELDDAVTKAKSMGVLVIAAASNWQNVRSVAFPARHNLTTMCIYSTNTGNQGSRFNPEPRDDSPNLAILGEGFQHPDQRRNKPLTGTSMATAVAAGLAAAIIDFSRQKDNKASIFRGEDVGKLPASSASSSSTTWKPSSPSPRKTASTSTSSSAAVLQVALVEYGAMVQSFIKKPRLILATRIAQIKSPGCSPEVFCDAMRCVVAVALIVATSGRSLNIVSILIVKMTRVTYISGPMSAARPFSSCASLFPARATFIPVIINIDQATLPLMLHDIRVESRISFAAFYRSHECKLQARLGCDASSCKDRRPGGEVSAW
ncbi:hypothetical protein HG530_001609 [Fusarium avenaceum]|nr:hypothetical protein HG530_001609 [Fusarium avenaceum]